MRPVASDGAIVAERALALVGTRYRPQGRSKRAGLDCVGVAAAALALDPERLCFGYALRGSSLAEIETELSANGLMRVWARRAGDLIVFQPGPVQLHLGICTAAGFVHADAGLRRVVERPWPAPWPIAGIWRAAAPPQCGDS